ncbi:MAG TPA: PQQ-binding-like beta-propeller repeat protein [Acidimicrobiales bacterium]|nr:PQQ-binding-like beta-propeller repeat protein [Acidimicrobiales bacterium]
MTRPVSLARILCLLALLVAAGCRSAGPDRGAPEPGAQGGGSNAGRPGSDATPAGNGWAWTAPAPAWIGMPAADDREITFTYGHQHLVLLDGDGRLRWDVYRLGLRDVAPRLTAEAVVAATDDGIAAFRRSDGGKIFEATVGERVNTPVIAGRMAVASTWEGSVVAFDLADGKVAWRATLPGPAIGPPATDETTVVVTWDRADRRTGGAVALDATTGRQRWAVPLPGGGISAPTVTPNGSAVAVAGDLAAHALAMSSGEPRWRTPVEGAGSPEVPPLVVDARSVLVAHRLGGLDLLDAATGRRTWQVTSDGAAVRGGPALGPAGSFAFPLDDGRVLLAGPQRATELLRPPAGRVSGLATGPGGLLVTTVREAPVNSVEAGPAW